ncbi:NUDIX domain-containing protein [Colletotrichum graminicola]|nr:NUDIX domain-containing protein [Colletotrichum graminicola]
MTIATLWFRQVVTNTTRKPILYCLQSRAFQLCPSPSHSSLTTRTMSTITLKDSGLQVKLPDGLSEDHLLAFKPFNNWVKGLTRSLDLQAKSKHHPFHPDPYQLRAVTVQAFDMFGSGRVGFLKVTADVKNGAGEGLPASVFLRGPSVGMLVMLIPDDVPLDSDERYVVLTVQPRVPVGSLSFVELPAGMVDDSGSFAGAAAKEIKEELGLDIHESELTCLSELAGAGRSAGNEAGEGLAEAMYPSAGGCDEFVTLYSHEKRIPRGQLSDWSGKLTGLRNHGEKITLKLVAMKDLWREGARDAKCLAALALWEGLRREGKL